MTDVTADSSPQGGAPKAAADLKDDAKRVASSIGDRAQQAADDAPRTAANLKDDAMKIASSVGERAQQTADQVRRQAAEQSAAAREWAADQADVLRDTVQTKPFIAVGVSAASAFAAGLILGVLLTRR